jgi:hypothetical protein
MGGTTGMIIGSVVGFKDEPIKDEPIKVALLHCVA